MDTTKVKATIHELYNRLNQRENQTAGLNAKYRSDFTDKSQFYSFLEAMSQR